MIATAVEALVTVSQHLKSCVDRGTIEADAYNGITVVQGGFLMREPVLYWPSGEPPGFPDGYWTAYLHHEPIDRIGPSTIIIFSKETGEVVYFGSASDEG